MTAKDAERIPRKDRREAGILRRFTTAYEEIARKNGKSTKYAGIGTYLLVADQEGAPEIFTAATTEKQAKLVFEEARRMVLQSPALKQRCAVLAENISVPGMFGRPGSIMVMPSSTAAIA